MKKIFFLTALLCASVAMFAINWNSYAWLGDGAGSGSYSNKYKVAPAEGQNVVNIQQPGWAAEPGIYTNGFGGAISSCSLGDKCAIDGGGIVLYLSAFTAQETEVTVVAAEGSKTFTVYYVDGTPSETPGKAYPELTINETAVTLSAESPAETFQIDASRNGNGAISYVSDKPGVASVSDGGFVTAVGRGTAIITVSVAETETYEADSKKLTVTVTGPINWAGIDWLNGSNDKYKLFITPYFGDEFGGKRIENNTNLWIGFPSASFGEMSIEPSGGDGAWKTFALTNFPKIENQFTVECGGTNYTFDVYYADGSDTMTAITNTKVEAKVIKVIENGQLFIIKNGVRYNALGVEVR